MVVIKVPKTPRKAFDGNRRVSALLADQVKHLEWAVLPAAKRKPYNLPKARVRTEAQAAARIGQLTRVVLEAHDAPPETRFAAKLPPLPRVPRKKTTTGAPGGRRQR